MVITLTRDDIEKAIRAYVKDEILGYSKKDSYEIKITQGKSASAKIELKELVSNISE